MNCSLLDKSFESLSAWRFKASISGRTSVCTPRRVDRTQVRRRATDERLAQAGERAQPAAQGIQEHRADRRRGERRPRQAVHQQPTGQRASHFTGLADDDRHRFAVLAAFHRSVQRSQANGDAGVVAVVEDQRARGSEIVRQRQVVLAGRRASVAVQDAIEHRGRHIGAQELEGRLGQIDLQPAAGRRHVFRDHAGRGNQQAIERFIRRPDRAPIGQEGIDRDDEQKRREQPTGELALEAFSGASRT